MRASRWRDLRLLLVPLAAAGLAVGLDWSRSPPAPPALSAADWGPAGYGPRDHAAAMARAEEQVALGRERVARAPGEWLNQESLARALMGRARLAHTYDDIADAEAILARAQAEAPPGGGPLLSAAAVAMQLHRLDESEAALDAIGQWAVPPGPAERAEALGLRGDIAFHRGDMGGAEAWYARAAAAEAGASVLFRQANLARARGEFDAALELFRRASAGSGRDTPFQHAATALQIGAVEQARGRYDGAARWFALADRLFPGYWLFEAHRAQSLALAGDLPAAIAAMRAVAARCPAAEVMDALALLLRAEGQAAESRRWAARADEEWERRLALAPAAAYGHALEHELVFGSPDEALRLARANLAARPYGEARLLLASALIASGGYREALDQLDRAEASGWRSAPLHALRAQLFELTGRVGEAAEEREAARALNPRIFAPETALVWFSHG